MAWSGGAGERLIPVVPRIPTGVLALVLDIVPGGVGTIVAGARVRQRRTVLLGVLQFLLVPVVIGWVWSAVWGVLIFQRASGPDDDD